MRIQQREGVGHPGCRGLRSQSRQPDNVVLLLEPDKEERLVLDDWPAHSAAVILIPQSRWIWRQRARREKRRRGGIKFISVVVVSRTMDPIRTGLQRQINSSSSVASCLRIRLRLRRKLINR